MKRILSLILVTAVILSSCSFQKGEFVTVKGTQFFREGKPYCFLGTNMWYGANLGMSDRERLVKELDLLADVGVTNLRILGASEKTAYHNTVHPAIQEKPGRLNESVLVGLDFLLDEMGQRGMTAVIYLNNYWVWSGGMAQYVSWVENEPLPNPFLEQYDWGRFMRFSGRFYTNAGANKLYRDFLQTLIGRRNSVNGKLYKDDATIMAWQLANEPRPNPGDDQEMDIDRFIRWVDETAGYIKSLDANHLVTTGNEGLAGSLESERCYLEAHRSENIDYMTFHLWVLNWSWYDPLQPEKTYPVAEKNALRYIRQHIDYAEQVGKPVTFEEFGIPRDGHSYSSDAPTTWRDRYFQRIFDAIYEGARSGSPLAGSNFWAWGGFGAPRDPSDESVWKAGDDFTGDPPQEPQGRNSVFAGDESTLRIMKEHGEKIKALVEKGREKR